MMGTNKIRNLALLPDLSLEELVPKDNLYRHLEETLDLSFVRDLVEDCYDLSRRPSVDEGGLLQTPTCPLPRAVEIGAATDGYRRRPP